MYNKAAAASTTYIGRHMLTILKGMMEKYCDVLVAQDTDSVTMTMKESIKNYDDVNAMVNDINNQLAEINPVFKVSAAEVVISMFNVAKK
jgi:DNA polymerase elongation subunit (family B)